MTALPRNQPGATEQGHCPSVEPSAESEVARLYRKVTWRLLPLLMIGYIVAYLDRVNIGFAKLTMLDHLALSDTAYAFGASIFFLGYVAFEVPSNLIMHKVGARVWLGRIMLSWGIVAITMMFTAELAIFFSIDNSTMFYILRFLLGVCEAGFFPGVVLYLNYWFPSARQSKILAGFILALPLSLAFGAPLSGWLMESTHGLLSLAGWQWMLGLEAAPAVVLGAIFFALLPNRIDDAKWLSRSEKCLLQDRLDNENINKSYRFGSALSDYRVLLLGVIQFSFNTGFYGLSFWLPSIIRASGTESASVIGVLTSIPFFVAAGVMTLVARHSERTGERRWHAALSALFGGLGLALSALFASNSIISILFLCVASSGILSMMPVFWTYPGRYLSGPAAAGGIAVISSIGALAGISGSFITNLAKGIRGDINDGTYLLAGAVILSGVLVLVLPREKSGSM